MQNVPTNEEPGKPGAERKPVLTAGMMLSGLLLVAGLILYKPLAMVGLGLLVVCLVGLAVVAVMKRGRP